MALLEIRENNDVVVVSFKPTKILDGRTIQEIGNEFAKLTLEASAYRRLLLDFKTVQFMASAMLGKIILLHKQCKRDKIKLKLCGISPEIMEVFKITNLNKLLEIHKTEPEAVEAFGNPARGWFRRQ